MDAVKEMVRNKEIKRKIDIYVLIKNTTVVKLRGLEDRLNNDPANIAHHLLWLRSEVVVREVISLAKQLNLQPYHPSHMNLRQEDLTRLFGDIIPKDKPTQKYPSHCVFFQFSQFEDWYFVIATVKNEFKSWLCCINQKFDQNGIFQEIVDLTYLDCGQLWRDQFIGKPSHEISDEGRVSTKRQFEEMADELTVVETKPIDMKKRRVSTILEGASSSFTNSIDK